MTAQWYATTLVVILHPPKPLDHGKKIMKTARKTKAEKQIDSIINSAFNRHCSNVQFNIMDLCHIHDDVGQVVRNGGDIDAAMIIARDKYRMN